MWPKKMFTNLGKHNTALSLEFARTAVATRTFSELSDWVPQLFV